MATRIVQGRDGEVREVNSTDHVEAVALAEQAEEIRAALADGKVPSAGALLGLPVLDGGDVWADIAGAEAVTGFPAKTITSWLARSGPKKCPFPAAHRFLYRLYWPLGVLQAWTEEYRAEYGQGAE